ncbi:MFS transporter [Ktedonosporobacter rubrisoli]|nr:MFS transporter [Ktedonosporobacter rubrisoli]
MFTVHQKGQAPSTNSSVLPWWLIGTIAVGTLLNPLNSSMISVSLFRLGSAFHITIASATWLISSFYLAAAVGQPLMGRLADLIGPRRIFCLGLVLVGITGLLAPWAPAFGWLVVLRVFQALGTSAAYPAGLALLRAQTRRIAGEGAKTPAAALGAISITSNVSAALGPTLGGVLMLMANWQAIFLINVPLVIIGLILAFLLLPRDEPMQPEEREPIRLHAITLSQIVRVLDVPGIILFSGTLTSLLVFLLALNNPFWLLLPTALVLLLLLLLWEYRTQAPFFNVRVLLSNRQLAKVYIQFAAVNFVFYSLFFGLPLWFEKARGFSPTLSGIIMLPFAGIGVLATFAAIQILRRSGIRLALLLGALALSIGTLLLLFLDTKTAVILLLAVIVILGIPNGLQNLGLQAALYAAAPAHEMGAAAGQFQTFRYVGSILSTSLLGLLFGGTITNGGLHMLAAALACISILLLIEAGRMRSPTNKSAQD